MLTAFVHRSLAVRKDTRPQGEHGGFDKGRRWMASDFAGFRGFDYGRWPKGHGTKPMSWGVALRL